VDASRSRLLELPRVARQPDDHAIMIETGGPAIAALPMRLLRVRPVTPADTGLLADLIARSSDTSRLFRFFRPLRTDDAIWQEAARVTQREPRLGTALVATAGELGQESAVALAELAHDRAAPTIAELAVLVRDDAQRKGVGAELLRLLVAVARRRGVRMLRATLWAENWAARRLVRPLGPPHHTEIHRGEMTIWVELSADPPPTE
jgi:GNAT superfamily N-acetyltransferase